MGSFFDHLLDRESRHHEDITDTGREVRDARFQLALDHREARREVGDHAGGAGGAGGNAPGGVDELAPAGAR
jgi:hypothetical protein